MSSIPFITYTPNNGFQLTPQTESFLTSISQTPIAVLSIVGNYRTGKSFFINKVLLNKPNGQGFTVGPSINPCTKGLWLWSEPLNHQNPEISEDVKVLLIDTEGFGGMDQNLSHNSRIGLFSLLLSSYFIYNSLGIIDENSLNSLSLIVSLGQEIMKQGESSGIFPKFLWILRDFALQMINTEGENMTNKDYLEKALEINNKMNEGKHKIRKIIREIFADRDCLTMVRPVGNEKDLQRLDNLEEKYFRKEFLDQIMQARNMIFSQIQPKKINGKIITAGILLELCKSFITIINGDKVPDIKTTWVYLCKSQMSINFSACMAYAEIEYDRLKTKEMNVEEIKIQGKRIKQETKEKLRKNLIGICERKELKELVQKLKDFIKSQNQELKTIMTHKIKKKANGFLEDKLSSFKTNSDLNPGSYLAEYKNLQEFFKKNNLMDSELMNFHHNLLKACLDNFHFEINNIKKNMNRMNDQRIVLLEQDLNNKKQEFSIEKEFLEKKIIESESKLQKYLKKEKEAAIISKTSSCSQTNEANEDNEFKKEYEKKYLTLIQEKNVIVEKMNQALSEKNKALEIISKLQKEVFEIKTNQSNINANSFNNSINIASKLSNPKEYRYKKFNEQEEDLMQITNKALTMTLEKSEEQTKNLKEKIIKLKVYKNAFKNTLQFQCQNCKKFISKSQYLDHCKRSLCTKDQDLINIYSSLNEIPNNKSINLSNIINTNSKPSLSIDTESQLICEEILNPIKENLPLTAKSKEVFQKSDLMFQKKKEKKENLEDFIERLNQNDKYSILQAKKKEMLSPKGFINNKESNYKSTLKKEQKKTNIFPENSVLNNDIFAPQKKKGDRLMTLPYNLLQNSENENPCSQRYDSMNFLFKSMRNCDIKAKKLEEKINF